MEKPSLPDDAANWLFGGEFFKEGRRMNKKYKRLFRCFCPKEGEDKKVKTRFFLFVSLVMTLK